VSLGAAAVPAVDRDIWWATPRDRPELATLLDDPERSRAARLPPGDGCGVPQV